MNLAVFAPVAAFLAGMLFVLASVVRRPEPQRDPDVTLIATPSPDIYWPLLLGTGERTFAPEVRLRIVAELERTPDDWRIPILLCAREQERDPNLYGRRVGRSDSAARGARVRYRTSGKTLLGVSG